MSGLESHHLGLGEKHQRRDSAMSLCYDLPLAQVISNLATYSMMVSIHNTGQRDKVARETEQDLKSGKYFIC